MTSVSAYARPCPQGRTAATASMNRVSTTAEEYVLIEVNIWMVSLRFDQGNSHFPRLQGIREKLTRPLAFARQSAARGSVPRGDRDGRSDRAGRDHGPGEPHDRQLLPRAGPVRRRGRQQLAAHPE